MKEKCKHPPSMWINESDYLSDLSRYTPLKCACGATWKYTANDRGKWRKPTPQVKPSGTEEKR